MTNTIYRHPVVPIRRHPYIGKRVVVAKSSTVFYGTLESVFHPNGVLLADASTLSMEANTEVDGTLTDFLWVKHTTRSIPTRLCLRDDVVCFAECPPQAAAAIDDRPIRAPVPSVATPKEDDPEFAEGFAMASALGVSSTIDLDAIARGVAAGDVALWSGVPEGPHLENVADWPVSLTSLEAGAFRRGFLAALLPRVICVVSTGGGGGVLSMVDSLALGDVLKDISKYAVDLCR